MQVVPEHRLKPYRKKVPEVPEVPEVTKIINSALGQYAPPNNAQRRKKRQGISLNRDPLVQFTFHELFNVCIGDSGMPGYIKFILAYFTEKLLSICSTNEAGGKKGLKCRLVWG